jgi:hypothetical protein
MGTVVLLRGMLRGMGREAECEIVAMRRANSQRGPMRPNTALTYMDFDVLNAPDDLPEGEYTLDVGGQILNVRKRRGLWHCAQDSGARF